MMKCTYNIGSKKELSYSELLKYIDDAIKDKKLDLSKFDIDDIVYSKTIRRDEQVKRIDELRSDYNFNLNTDKTLSVSSVIDGEPSKEGSKLSVLQFIDSPLCDVITTLNIEDYRNNVINELVKNKLTEEEAIKSVDETIQYWKQIQEDSILLHKLFTHSTTRNKNGDFSEFSNSIYSQLPDYLKDPENNILQKLFKGLKKVYHKEKYFYKNSITRTNVNFSSKIKDSEHEIVGHADYIFIGEDGRLHLYLYKVTTEPIHKWSRVKREKYLQQLAFLKQMLNYNGIDTENMTLHIIPVQLTYNEDHTEIKDIFVGNAEEFSGRSSSSGYSMHKYERNAKKYIQSGSFFKTISSEPINRGLEVSKMIFPDLNLRTEGIGQSAKMWIIKAPNCDIDGTESLVIKTIGEQDHFYDVIINGKTYPIKSKKNKENNEEILKLVQDHIDELQDNIGYSIQKLKDIINASYENGYPMFNSIKGFKNISSKLNSILKKYLTPNRDSENNIIGYDWEILDDLLDAGILLFKHKSGIIDIITLSALNLNAKIKFTKGTNILGCYKRDDQYIDLEANYGNIEIVRTMAMLNELLPYIKDATLGTIGVISTMNGDFVRYNIANFNQNYYQEITKVVNKENSNLNIQNNFKMFNVVDDVEYLIQEYLKIIEGKSQEEISSNYESYGTDVIENLDKLSKYEQAEALLNIMKLIENDYRKAVSDYSTYVSESFSKDILKLYDLVGKAYFYITGQQIIRRTSFDNFDKIVISPIYQENPNMQYITGLLQTTYDNIASEFESIYNKDIRNVFDEFYNEIGYTHFQNRSMGNQAQQFYNLYEIDPVTGNKTMNFKNPYDIHNNLNNAERKLLKKILYSIHKITKPEFKINPDDTSKMLQYIENNPDYLWVPLERASKSTSRQSFSSILARFKNGFKRIKQIEQRFDEFVNNVTQEERDLLGSDSDEFYTFQVKNPFENSTMLGIKSRSQIYTKRQSMIETYTPDFFEINLENIFIDYVVKKIQTTQLNKFMTISKAFLLQLHLTGNFSGNKEIVEKEVKQIQDYLKINVFNTSIMNKTEKSIISVITPVKRFATNLLLGGNVVGFVRDITQGVLENFTRSITKFNTDITPQEVTKAYWYVTKNCTSDAMAANLLSKLCLKYRLSNTDVGRIAERAKTQRNGIFNYDNWLYGTMRSPDFINRMVLFVARAMHDGVWDAFELDENNNLKYNWKLDGRFSIYAKGESMKNHPQYEKQKSAYFSQVMQYNLDHPENKIDFSDDLPEPYNQIQVKNIRMLADNIYGAYDISKKPMGEFHAIGTVFAMFTTWMQGIVNNYIMKPQKNLSKLMEIQDTDEYGNLLYFDENGGITTDNTGRPVKKWVPCITEGILHTIGRIAKCAYKDGYGGVKEFLEGNDIAKSNLLKLGSDGLILLLLGLLFKLVLSGEYDKYKKTAEDNPVLQNLITEILYKGTSRSYDTFKGLYNLIDFIGNNNATPIYSVPTEIIRNTFNTITGDKSFDVLLINGTGFGRSFKDTYNIYKKSHE